MVRNVKIYVRNVYWRTQQIDVSTPVYNIALYSPQSCYAPEDFGGHDVLHCNIREERDIIDGTWKSDPYLQTTYRIDIDAEPDVCIYDSSSLIKVRLPKMPKYYPEPNRKVERWEILDLNV